MNDHPNDLAPAVDRPRPEAAFFCDLETNLGRVYGGGRRQRIEQMTRCHGPVVTTANFNEHAPALSGLEAVFSTWGMPILAAAQIERLPELRAVFYAAGTVQGFARPYLERGIEVISAWAANAVPVSEFTLAQILLSNKGYFRNTRESRGPAADKPFVGAGNFDVTVSLLGAGQIGRRVIELLRPFALRVVVFDPFLPDAEAARLGVVKVSLEEAFRQGNTVSNHLANLPATVGMITGAHFGSMRENATFINTGRPATVCEDELCEVLRRRPDLTALLDVVTPDLLPLFHGLPNVQTSTHIAGSTSGEVVRMADCVIEAFHSWRQGEPSRHRVTLPMLDTMA